MAEAVIKEIETAGVWDGKIVTEVTPAEIYYPAEEYHQDYFENNPYQPYCQFVVAPKVLKLRKAFAEKLKNAKVFLCIYAPLASSHASGCTSPSSQPPHAFHFFCPPCRGGLRTAPAACLAPPRVL